MSSIAYTLNLYKIEDNNATSRYTSRDGITVQLHEVARDDNTDKDYISRLFIEYTRTYCYTIDFDIIHIEIKILDNLHNRLWHSNGKTMLIKKITNFPFKITFVMAKEVVEVAATATARVRHTIDEVREILASRGAEIVKATILNARMITVDVEDENGELRQENRFVLNLDKSVKGTWKDGDVRTIGDSNTIIVSPIGMYAIVGREPLFSRFLTKWHEVPALLCSHLSECEITLAQEEVKEKTVYTNPFNDKQSDIKKDTIINTPLEIVPKGLSKKHMEDQLMNVSLF